VQLLLDHGADVNVQKADLWAPLHLASASGHLKVVELLLDHSAEVDVQNEDQKTPLYLASGNGKHEVARLLITHGSNVTSQDTQGWTPLHSAARNGYLDVVKLLLDSGADIKMRDGSDKNAFDIALDNGKRDVVDFLAKHDTTLGTRLGDLARSASLEAASQSSLPGIEMEEPQRSRGDADEEESHYEQSTTLHSAVKNGNIDVVKRLLDRGADVNEQAEELQTPLDAASMHGVRARKCVRVFVWQRGGLCR
jgi:ankyrin repeat protein